MNNTIPGGCRRNRVRASSRVEYIISSGVISFRVHLERQAVTCSASCITTFSSVPRGTATCSTRVIAGGTFKHLQVVPTALRVDLVSLFQGIGQRVVHDTQPKRACDDRLRAIDAGK